MSGDHVTASNGCLLDEPSSSLTALMLLDLAAEEQDLKVCNR
jgi:hypothetical protein